MDSWNNDALILEEDMECQLLSEIPILPEVFLALFGNINTLNQTLGTWTVYLYSQQRSSFTTPYIH